MGMMTIDGVSFYTISRDDLERMGVKPSGKPSYFAQAVEGWKEGVQKDGLSENELNALRQKYNSNSMTRKDCIDLLGDLVNAGAMTKEEASSIYLCSGCPPIDISKLNQGFLQKEPVPGSNAVRDAWREMNAGNRTSGENLEQEMGYEYFKIGYEVAKMDTTINDPENDPYFVGCRQYLDILEALAR